MDNINTFLLFHFIYKFRKTKNTFMIKYYFEAEGWRKNNMLKGNLLANENFANEAIS